MNNRVKKGVDRWFWVFYATLFLVIVLSGFVPNSINRIAAIQDGLSDPFPWTVHAHAVVMGCWILLLVTQALLMGSGKRQLHKSLGMISVVMAPLVILVMLLMMGRVYAGANAMPEGVPLAAISERYAFLLTVMGRAVVLFTIFFLWAYRTRLNDSDTHKRMMFLATWATIDAAIARIPGSFELGAALGLRDIGLTSRDDIPHFWMLVTLVPAMLYDLIRRKRIHSAWLTGIVIFLVFAIPAHFLEAAPQWWQDIIGNVTGRS